MPAIYKIYKYFTKRTKRFYDLNFGCMEVCIDCQTLINELEEEELYLLLYTNISHSEVP